MLMKLRLMNLLAVVFSFVFVSSISSFAGQWISAGDNWYYLGDNNTYVTNTWVGNYYLGSDGVMLKDTYTPDGYYVDKYGKWDGYPSVNSVLSEPVNAIGQVIYNSPIVKDQINWNEYTSSYMGASVQIIESTDKLIYDKGTYYEIPNAVVESCIIDSYGDHEYYPITYGPIYIRKNAQVVDENLSMANKEIKTAEQIVQELGCLYRGGNISLCTIACETEFDAYGYITKLTVFGFE